MSSLDQLPLGTVMSMWRNHIPARELLVQAPTAPLVFRQGAKSHKSYILGKKWVIGQWHFHFYFPANALEPHRPMRQFERWGLPVGSDRWPAASEQGTSAVHQLNYFGCNTLYCTLQQLSDNKGQRQIDGVCCYHPEISRTAAQDMALPWDPDLVSKLFSRFFLLSACYTIKMYVLHMTI